MKGDVARMWEMGTKMVKEESLAGEYNQLGNRIVQDVAEIVNEEDGRGALLGQMRQGVVKARNTTVVVAIAVLVIGLVVLSFSVVLKKAVRPLNDLTEKIELISDGDLTVTVGYDGRDEVGRVSTSVGKMIASLNGMIGTILTLSRSVVTTIDALQVNAEKTTEGTREQTDQASQISAAAEEMAQTVTTIARSAAVASDTSAEAMSAATAGQEIAATAMEIVNNVYASTIELADTVGSLNRKTGEIGDIVAVINDIADQTNLLALNAAIEAARAGEQGRGFSVVADEVKKLAEKTLTSTTEISEKIKAVQKESEKTAKSMGGASQEVTKATDHIRKMGESLRVIVDTVAKVQDQIGQIAVGVGQQATTAEEMARNVEGTRSISSNIQGMAEEVVEKTRGLLVVSGQLEGATSGFKTNVL
jgi:methyl-accepting chemotaxis protein